MHCVCKDKGARVYGLEAKEHEAVYADRVALARPRSLEIVISAEPWPGGIETKLRRCDGGPPVWRSVGSSPSRLAPATINLRLAAVRRLAYEASDNGLLNPDMAAGIRRGKGAKHLRMRLGNFTAV
jgi:hypothetical protein